LPSLSSIIPANYPKLDVVPPTDSAEVQQWIAEVQSTGIQIPNISPTQPGGCPNNTQAAADTSRCWWTCGGCVRTTDIADCPTQNTWGLTYDDGPAYYTPNLLNYLDQNNLKSTFFVIGSRAVSFPAILQSEYLGAHQLSVHTWSHSAPLTTLTNEQVIAELGWTKKVMKAVTGVTPNTMRPPFGDIDDRVRAISLAMGLTPIMWTRISATQTFDTGDYNIHGGSITSEGVMQNWYWIMGNASKLSTGFIVLEHDLFQQSVEIATGYILPDALARTPKLTLQPVITCLGMTLADAYIETNDNKTNPPPATLGPTGTSSGRPSSTGTNGNTGQSGALSLHSLPDAVVLGLLSLIAGSAVLL
jgi:peptidoglycan/xylan/chitin deacetylase (PgdA/CDA1 family)